MSRQANVVISAFGARAMPNQLATPDREIALVWRGGWIDGVMPVFIVDTRRLI